RKSRYCCRTKKSVLAIGFTTLPDLIVILGGEVAVFLLDASPTLTTMGISPISTVEGKVKSIESEPGKSVEVRLPGTITVAPTVTLTEAGKVPRTPVSDTRSTVGTCVPVASADVTLNGSAKQTAGLVTLQTEARPPGPLVLVKMSG